MDDIIKTVERLYNKHDSDKNGVNMEEFMRMGKDDPTEEEL